MFRSTEEIFALFITLAFTVDAVSSIVKGMLSCIVPKTQILIQLLASQTKKIPEM